MTIVAPFFKISNIYTVCPATRARARRVVGMVWAVVLASCSCVAFALLCATFVARGKRGASHRQCSAYDSFFALGVALTALPAWVDTIPHEHYVPATIAFYASVFGVVAACWSAERLVLVAGWCAAAAFVASASVGFTALAAAEEGNCHAGYFLASVNIPLVALCRALARATFFNDCVVAPHTIPGKDRDCGLQF